MSIDVQSVPVVLEPVAQAIADSVATPPFLTELRQRLRRSLGSFRSGYCVRAVAV